MLNLSSVNTHAVTSQRASASKVELDSCSLCKELFESISGGVRPFQATIITLSKTGEKRTEDRDNGSRGNGNL